MVQKFLLFYKHQTILIFLALIIILWLLIPILLLIGILFLIACFRKETSDFKKIICCCFYKSDPPAPLEIKQEQDILNPPILETIQTENRRIQKSAEDGRAHV